MLAGILLVKNKFILILGFYSLVVFTLIMLLSTSQDVSRGMVRVKFHSWCQSLRISSDAFRLLKILTDTLAGVIVNNKILKP